MTLLRIRFAFVFALFVLAVSQQAFAQVEYSATASGELNTNPLQAPTKGKVKLAKSTFVGSGDAMLGYNFDFRNEASLLPWYSFGYDYYASQPDYNSATHSFGITYSDPYFFLSAKKRKLEIALDNAALDDSTADDIDPAQDSLVQRLQNVADAIEAVPLSGVPGAPPAPATQQNSGVTKAPESNVDDEDDSDDGSDDQSDATDERDDSQDSVSTQAEPETPPANPLEAAQRRIVARITTLADSLYEADIDTVVKSSISTQVHAIQDTLRVQFPSDPFSTNARTSLDGFLTALNAYQPSATGDTVAGDEEVEEPPYAAVSLSTQPLNRNSLADYGFYTGSSDSASHELQAGASYAFEGYSGTADSTSARYSTGIISLWGVGQQRLSNTVNIWESYAYAHERYPDEPLLDNAQHTVSGQLRYQPSAATMLVADLSLGIKVYANTPGTQADEANVAADTTSTTSIVDIGGGGFFRPGDKTLLGAVLEYQTAPGLHPRLATGAAVGGLRSIAGSVTDDIYSYTGPDIQVLLEQELPGAIVFGVHSDFGTRKYGTMILKNRRRSITLSGRTDTRRTFELQVEREFGFGSDSSTSLLIPSLTVRLYYGNINNNSTSYKGISAEQATRPGLNPSFAQQYVGLELSVANF